MPFSCPSCDRPILNRRSPICGYCGAPVPESHQMNEETAQKMLDMKEKERKEHKTWRENDRERSTISDGI